MSIRNLEALLQPRGPLVVVGDAQDAPAASLLRQLDRLPSDRRLLLHGRRDGWHGVDDLSRIGTLELCVVLDPQLMSPAVLETLAERGCRGMIWLSDAPVPVEVLQVCRRSTLRVLGPRSAGAAHVHGVTVSAWNLPAGGSTALIAQSRSIASAALDWAAGHALGFSWMAVTGGEADVDVGDLLDYAALDPTTTAVVLQISQIRSARKFMSAARACARAKPVIVLQTPLPDTPEGSPQDPVLSAAFGRAGLLEVDRVTALFAAITALERIGESPSGRIAVVGTGTGICQLACAALLRENLVPLPPGEEQVAQLQARHASLRRSACAIDLDLADDRTTIATLESVLAGTDVDMAMLVRSPAPGREDATLVQALAASALRRRVVVVLLGQQRAAPALHLCAEAGIAAFSSVEAASRAIGYRREYRRTQNLLMQTPTLDPNAHRGDIAPTVPVVPMPGKGPFTLAAAQAQELLGAYGLQPAAWVGTQHRGLRVQLLRHPQMGMYLRARLDPAPDVAPTAITLPPLDDVLATLKLQEAALDLRDDVTPGLRVSDYALAVSRLAQLTVEQPLIDEADVHLVPGKDIADVANARIVVADPTLPERQRLALAPYPRKLTHDAMLRDGRRVRIRPIRPTDEPALIRMLSQARPEDIRLRFFRYIRQFTHAMAARMTQIDYDREMTFVALPDSGEDEVLALSTVVFDPDGHEGEYAVLVRREYVGQRLGLQLMQDILIYAAARGARRVFGDVLSENGAMLGLASHLGFERYPHPDDPGCVRVMVVPQLPSHPPAWTKHLSSAPI